MMLTSTPAPRSAFASCHTRRSNGLSRFSTRMRTRFGRIVFLPRAINRTSPADAFVYPGDTARVADADEIDAALPRAKQPRHFAEFRCAVADDDGLRVRQHIRNLGHHQPRDVRNLVQDVVAVCAANAGHADVA